MSAPTILVVDDDEVLNQVLRRVLTRDGYTVVEAGSVTEAMERARAQRPALALVDLRLPDGDGVDLARMLPQQVGRFPLILMTAYPLRLRDQPELARGFAHVLTKPLDLEELRRAIALSLGTSAPAAPATVEAPAPVEQAAIAPPRPPEVAAPAALLAPPAKPARRHRLRWAVLGGIVAVAGLAVAGGALGTPSIQRLLRPLDSPIPIPRDTQARLVSESEEEIELPRRVVERLGVHSEPVKPVAEPRQLELAGSLSFNPNKLGRVQARFGGEVISISKTTVPDAQGNSQERELRYGDAVAKGQILAVVLSKDLGEKKSELVDSLVKLWYDETLLENLEELFSRGETPAATVRAQRANVASDRNAVGRVELTLRTWRVPEDEIKAVKDEAKQVFQRKGQRDVKKESEWARVEVRAPFDGTIVEKNVALGNIVDTTFDLFKIADLRKLGVLVHAYEEDLRELQGLLRKQSHGYPWQVRAGADMSRQVLKSEGMQQIGLVVDPTQHTDPIMGLVDNSDGKLRVGQFVTATVDLPAPTNVVSLPASAVVEDGTDSIVFVQPDPSKPRYVMRRVVVAMRLRDVIYVRSELSDAQRKKGLQAVQPGEFVVTDGVLELKAALEDLQAKAKAQK
jgi:cobalt-zinc-cadmium efflux system membrane fusion protein